MSKGSKPRPTNGERYRANHDRIFSRMHDRNTGFSDSIRQRISGYCYTCPFCERDVYSKDAITSCPDCNNRLQR